MTKTSYQAQVTPLNDIDVIYFNPIQISEDSELKFEQDLKHFFDIKWSVKNQASMHNCKDDLPYQNTCDAISCWSEVGVYWFNMKLRLLVILD